MKLNPHVELVQFDVPIIPVTKEDTEFLDVLKTIFPISQRIHPKKLDNTFSRKYKAYINQHKVKAKTIDGVDIEVIKIDIINDAQILLFHKIEYSSTLLKRHAKICSMIDRVYPFKHTEKTQLLQSDKLNYNYFYTVLEKSVRVTNPTTNRIKIPINTVIMYDEKHKLQTLDELILAPKETIDIDTIPLFSYALKTIEAGSVLSNNQNFHVSFELLYHLKKSPTNDHPDYAMINQLHYNGVMYNTATHFSDIGEFKEAEQHIDEIDKPFTLTKKPSRNIFPNMVAGTIDPTIYADVPLAFLDDKKKTVSIKYRHNEVIDVIGNQLQKTNGSYNNVMEIVIS